MERSVISHEQFQFHEPSCCSSGKRDERMLFYFNKATISALTCGHADSTMLFLVPTIFNYLMLQQV
jgi:hypothetical protein